MLLIARLVHNQAVSKPAKGSAHGRAKVTELSVQIIRGLYAEGIANSEELARCFGITSTSLRSILHRKTWAHVEDL